MLDTYSLLINPNLKFIVKNKNYAATKNFAREIGSSQKVPDFSVVLLDSDHFRTAYVSQILRFNFLLNRAAHDIK